MGIDIRVTSSEGIHMPSVEDALESLPSYLLDWLTPRPLHSLLGDFPILLRIC